MSSLLEKVLSAKPKSKSKSGPKKGPHGMMLGRFGETVFEGGCNRLGLSVYQTRTEHEFTDYIVNDWKIQVKTVTLNAKGQMGRRLNQTVITKMIANKVDILVLVCVSKNPTSLHEHTIHIIPLRDLEANCANDGSFWLPINTSIGGKWNKFKDGYAILERKKIRALVNHELVVRPRQMPAMV